MHGRGDNCVEVVESGRGGDEREAVVVNDKTAFKGPFREMSVREETFFALVTQSHKAQVCIHSHYVLLHSKSIHIHLP